MDRRGFLKGIGLVIGGIALEQAVPLGRVWSFPAKIVPLNVAPIIVHPDAYEDWLTFSDIGALNKAAVGQEINKAVGRAAKELESYYGRIFIRQPGTDTLWWARPVLTDGPPRPDLRTVETVICRMYTAF